MLEPFLSGEYKTCRGIKLLNFGVASGSRQHIHGHWQGHEQTGAPQAPLR